MTALANDIAGLTPTQRKLLELALKKKGIELTRHQIVPRAAHAETYPLSFGQQRLWFLHQLQPDNPAYNVTAPLRLEGGLDPAALRRALAALSARHETLRTSFPLIDEQVAQKVAAHVTDRLGVVDLRRLAAADRERETAWLTNDNFRRPFDLEHGPLVRTVLVQVDAGRDDLLICLHHTVSDGLSIGIFFRELWALYGACARGEPVSRALAALPKLPIQYVDFALWQREQLAGDKLQEQLDYWRGQLAGLPPLLDLPIDRPWPAVRGHRGGGVVVNLSPATTAGVRKLAQESRTTPFVVLLAALQLLLQRSTRENKIAVGTPIGGRGRQEIEGLIGFFVNTQVLYTDFTRLPGGPSETRFRQLIETVRQVNEGANAHQDLPFERLVEELQPERSLNHSPLFQVNFAFQAQPPGSGMATGGVRAAFRSVSETPAMFELHLALSDRGATIGGSLAYSRDLFDATTAARLTSHYAILLEAALAAPDGALAALPIWGAAERHQVLREWNPAVADPNPPGRPWLHERFWALAQREPARPALVFDAEAGRQALGYGELAARAAHLAARLRALGVGPDRLVGLCLERSLEMVVGIYGVLLAGGAWVPLDPGYPAERLDFMLADSGVEVVLTQSQLAPRLEQPGRTLLVLDQEPWPADPAGAAGFELPELGAHSLAYMIYTSGSTGRPKGAMNSHGAILNRILWMQDEYRLAADDRVLQKTPFSFDVSVWEFLWPLAVGARLVVAKPQGHQDPEYLAELIARESITTLHFVPSMLRAFLEQPDLSGCGTLRRVIASGEALGADLARQLAERLDAGLHNLYGPTEAAIDVTYQPCTRLRPGAPGVPIGRPIAHTWVVVLDRELRPVPIGIAGELALGGVGLARGYRARPGLSAEKFVPDALSERAGARLYKTGDLVRALADGALDYLDRLDFQVKIRGFRIELGEIEAVLARHPEIRESAVVATAAAAGGGARRLLAYYVAAAGAGELGPRELRAFCAERLPEHMVPAFFIRLEAMPLSPNGKLDRGALGKRGLPGAEADRAALAATWVAAQTPAQEALVAIWERLLKLERVGIHDNFFEIGGDSILGLQMVARAAKVGLRLRPLHVFQHQTIAELALAAEREAAQGDARARRSARPVHHPRFPLAPVGPEVLDPLLAELGEVEDVYPLAPAQEGMLFFRLYEPGSKAYFQQKSRRFHGGLDLDAFIAAWRQLVAHHTILRTCFLWQGVERPLQVVMREVELPCERHDWRHLEGAAQEEQLARFIAEDRERGLALERAPLLRLAFFQLADDLVVFNWTYHHILLDGWSLTLLLRELIARYVGLCTGRQPRLPVTRPFRDFIEWLAEQDEQEAEAFWQAELAGFSEPISLGLEPATTAPRHRREQLEVRLIKIRGGASEALQRFAASSGVTLNTVVQAVWAILLARSSGVHDVLFGATSSGRSAPLAGIEAMIGMFINTLPVRVRFEPEAVLGAWLRALQQRQVEARTYEHTQLAQIQRWCAVPAPRMPFESLLVFENTPKEFDFGIDEIVTRGPAQPASTGPASTDPAPTDPAPTGPAPAPPPAPGPTPAAARGAVTTSVDRQFERTSYPMTLMVVPVEDEITVQLGVDRRVFDPSLAERLLVGFETLLVQMGDAAQRPLRGLSLLSEATRRQVLELNPAAIERIDGFQTELAIAERATGYPDAVAVIHGDHHLSYGELVDRVRTAAHELRRRGVGCETRVVVLLERSPEMVIAILGVLAAGGAYVPLDPATPPARLVSALADTEARLVLTSPALAERVPADVAEVILVGELERVGTAPSAPGVVGRNLAYLIYTSGSTGRPKAVMIERRSLADYAQIAAVLADLGPGDRVLQFASLAFDASAEEIYPCLMRGATLVLRDDAMLDLGRFLAVCAAWRITVLDLPTAFWHELAAVVDSEGLAIPAALRLLILGGEKARAESVARWLALAPSVQLVNTYGPTEATVVATIALLGAPRTFETHTGFVWEELPIGLPRPNSRVHVRDLWGDLAPIGVAGELLLGGLGLARGYLARPALTAAAFIPDPWSGEEGERLYRTGDRARLRSDLQLEFLGRIDRQVKIRGFRVELGEVESALAAHPAVRAAAVIAAGGTMARLVAFLEPAGARPEGAAQPSVETLRSFLRTRLPEHMVPASLIWLETLPRTPSGKIDRRALPASEEHAPAAELLAPRDEIERRLVAIFERLFERRGIDVRADFFALGGNSILALRLIVELRRGFGRELPLAVVFERPSVEALAELLRREGAAETGSPLVAIRRDGARPPLYFLHPAGGTVLCYRDLATQLGGDQPFFALEARGLDGRSEPLASIEEMAAHYVEAVRGWQPVGPYRIGGWSTGGVQAYAVAVLLEQTGAEVERLVLIDTLAPSCFPRWNEGELMLQFGVSLGVPILASSPIGPLRFLELEPAEQLAHIGERARQRGSLGAEEGLERLHTLFSVFRNNVRAVERYQPPSWGGPLLYFRPEGERGQSDDGTVKGWREHAPEIDVEWVPGTHGSMVAEPHVSVLARRLRRHLDPKPTI